MGVSGSVTSAVSSTSVTLPSDKLTLVGVSVYAQVIGGYCSIPVDSSRNALIPFCSAIDVTTLKIPTTQIMDNNGMWHIHWTPSGSTLNYSGVGLTSGTFVFYYGTPFQDSKPLENYTGIAVALTTNTSDVYTFPSGKVRLMGIIDVIGGATTETNQQVRHSWNTGTGRSVLVTFSMVSIMEVIPLGPDVDGGEGLSAAQSVTVTTAYSGTHVGLGYTIIYYKLGT